ncbi:MAG: RNA polymerase Rpb4 family protein [Candidatus Altiarchaeota archaeon]|nr:RNA polymerase Rpb4 family protein [Candidatus Altiarchaeota archaeon]
MKIIDERYIPLVEVKEILGKKERDYQEEEKEMLYEQKRALDHARRATKLESKDVKEMKKKLDELEMGLSQEQLIKICNILPETVDDIRAVFAKERFKYSEEEIRKVIDILDQYR